MIRAENDLHTDHFDPHTDHSLDQCVDQNDPHGDLGTDNPCVDRSDPCVILKVLRQLHF